MYVVQAPMAFSRSVSARPLSLGFGAKAPKIQYSAMFLEDNNPLWQLEIPTGWTRYAHHCTIQFQPKNGYPTSSGTLTVTEIRRTPEVIYAIAQPPQEILDWVAAQGIPTPPWHITIASAPGIKPVRARELTEQGIKGNVQPLIPPLILPFKAGAFP